MRKFLKINKIELIFLIPMIILFILIKLYYYKPVPSKETKEQVERELKPYMDIRHHIDSLQRENDSLKLIIKKYEN